MYSSVTLMSSGIEIPYRACHLPVQIAACFSHLMIKISIQNISKWIQRSRRGHG